MANRLGASVDGPGRVRCAAWAAELLALAVVSAVVSSTVVSAKEVCLSGIPTLRDWSRSMPDTVDLASIAASPRPSAELEVSCVTILNNAGSNGSNVVVRIGVPAGQSLIVSDCQLQSYWNVRMVLGLGANSWLTLRSWDVELGGVTIESVVGGSAAIENATVIVDGSSRILARSSVTSHPTSTEADDVHALSVVRPTVVNGFTLIVTNGSSLNATHQGDQVLYATAACVTSRSGLPAAFLFRRIRIQISHGAAVTASSGRFSGGYTTGTARRAYAATVHVAPNSTVDVTGLLLLASNNATVTVLAEDGSAAMGLVVRNALRTPLPGITVLTVRDFAAVVLDSRVSVIGMDNGNGLSALGISASALGAIVEANNVLLFAGRANVSVTSRGSGFSVSALGISGNERAVIIFGRVTIYATSSNIRLQCTFHGGGVTALGVGSGAYTTVNGTHLDVFVSQCVTALSVGNLGQGASLFGVATDSYSPTTLTSISIYAIDTVAVMFVTNGYGATIGGLAFSRFCPATVENVSTVAARCDFSVKSTSICFGVSILGILSYLASTVSATVMTTQSFQNVLFI
jgi:hypothetical protein